MIIIEIAALENGAHRNQTYNDVLPDGWAMIPEDMEIPDAFPFVNIEVSANEESGEMYVTSMTAGVMPELEPEPEREASDKEVLNALLGVNE